MSLRRSRLFLLLASAALALGPGAASAATGTDSFGCYAYSDTLLPLAPDAPTFSFEDISATGARLFLGDDQVSGPIAIGFGFDFYDALYDEVFVSSNGFVSFEPMSTDG
ncbi:MAG: hypothetical protein HKP30_14160, partial [Myxococcales bacterium]|nr:hypothetical protein [Myxococcales bacterium]